MADEAISKSEIPIIDLAEINGSYEDISLEAFRKVAIKFGDAMSNIGFCYLINHDFNMEIINNLYKAAANFFTQPNEYKKEFSKTDALKSLHGYNGQGQETLNEFSKNSIELKESFDCWGFDQYDPSKFPNELKKELFDAIRLPSSNLAKKLLRCIGIYLKLEDEEFFVKNHRSLDFPEIRSQNLFRIMNYFSMDPSDTSIPPNAIRLGEHSDWGSISLLYQDAVGGLEVKKVDGTWIPAIPIPGSIIVNGGQLMELWTSGIIYAAPHRVRIIDNERTRKMARQSFIHFINPDGETMVEPIPNLKPRDTLSKTNVELLKEIPINACDHQIRRLALAYY